MGSHLSYLKVILLTLFIYSFTSFSLDLRSAFASTSLKLSLESDDYITAQSLTPRSKKRFKINLNSKYEFSGLVFHLNSWAQAQTTDSPENSSGLKSPSLNDQAPQAQHTTFGDITEAFLEYRILSNLRFRGGYNIFNWGVLDGYSPLDNVSPQVLLKPLDPVKRGSLSLESKWELEDSQFVLLWIPQQSKSILPYKNSRWLPRDFILNYNTTFGDVTLPPNLDYTYKKSTELDQSLTHNWGLRWIKRWDHFDLYLSHFEGSSPSPQIRPELNITLGQQITVSPQVKLQPVFYRQRTSGFSFVYFTDSWILRGESAYKHSISQSDGLTPWSLENGLGLELSSSLLGYNILYLLQIYHSNYPDLSSNFPISHSRIFEEALSFGLRWSFSERNTLSLKLLHQLKTQNYVGGISWNTPFWGSSKAEFSYDFIDGEVRSLLGTYKNNDSLSFKWIYYY